MSDEKIENCGNCHYWRGGECRRDPPKIVKFYQEVKDRNGYWPETTELEWCGEHSPRYDEDE